MPAWLAADSVLHGFHGRACPVKVPHRRRFTLTGFQEIGSAVEDAGGERKAQCKQGPFDQPAANSQHRPDRLRRQVERRTRHPGGPPLRDGDIRWRYEGPLRSIRRRGTARSG